MNPTATAESLPRKSSAVLAIAMLFVGLAIGAGVASGIAGVVSLVADDSRSRLALSDILTSDLPAFASSPAPSSDACGDRFGCVEAVEGDGVSIFRYSTLDRARQAVIYNDATDFYRSDRLVLEFEEDFSAEERFRMLQVVEGTWTASET